MKSQPIQDDTTEEQKVAENKEPAEEVMEAKQPARMPSRPTKQRDAKSTKDGAARIFCVRAFIPTKGCISCDTGMDCPRIRHSAKCLRENTALRQPQPPVLLDDDMAEFY